MKVALLLSGLPRKVEEGYKATWKNIIDNYDTDVYLHTWKDNTWGCNWEDVLNIYNTPQVKSIHIQSPFKFTKYKVGIKLPHNDTSRPLPEYDVMSCFRQFPMFYSWQKIFQDYLDNSNENYDCVIRSRYDMYIHRQELDLINLDLNKLNHGPGGRGYDDNLCITNPTNAYKVFYNIFNKLVNYSRKVGTLPEAEESWKNMIHLSDCLAEIRPELSFSVLRENMLWWGDQEGNIIS